MNKYHVTDIEFYTTEMGDGDPEWLLFHQEDLSRRCLGRWKAKDEEDLLDQIFNLAGFPVETMTYKTNNLSISYPRYGEDSSGKK